MPPTTAPRIPAPVAPVTGRGPAAPPESAWSALADGLDQVVPGTSWCPARRDTWALEGHPRSVHRARALLRRALERGCSCQDDRLQLVVSELVTNALTHTASNTVWVRLETRSSGCAGVAVIDEGPRPVLPLCPRMAGPSSTGGRGLHLVHRVSRAWGWQYLGHGSMVWALVDDLDGDGGAEIALPPGIQAAVDELLAADAAEAADVEHSEGPPSAGGGPPAPRLRAAPAA
jgi:anti-sigma regulatory factor (Ser/Thr protein kinase)